MTASALSISLAQKGQRGAMSRLVRRYGLASSSSTGAWAGLGAAVSGLRSGRGLGVAGARGSVLALAAGALTAKMWPQALHLMRLPCSSADALICLLHSGQEMTMVVAMMRPRRK